MTLSLCGEVISNESDVQGGTLSRPYYSRAVSAVLVSNVPFFSLFSPKIWVFLDLISLRYL